MINRQCRAIFRTTVSGIAPDPFAFPQKIRPLRQTGEFYSGYIIRRRCRNKPNRTREDPFPSLSGPSIDFPGYPKYYKRVNATVLIPVAFPVAGPAANMATACMNR